MHHLIQKGKSMYFYVNMNNDGLQKKKVHIFEPEIKI